MEGGGFMPEEGGGFMPSGCEKCNSLTFSQEWYKAFGVMLCTGCTRSERLISKGNAKSLYLVTDGDLKRMGCLTKQNPQHKQWTAMKLYLQRQVEEIAHRKHGGEDGVTEERHRRAEALVADRVAKRQRDEGAVEREERRQQALRQKLESEAAAGPSVLLESVTDPEQGVVQHQFAEGVDFEDI